MKNSIKSVKKVISHAANQSVRLYPSNQEYLYAMREDLADWFKGLYAVDINVTNFFDVLSTGTLLCQHANNITTCANYVKATTSSNHNMLFPQRVLVYNQGRYVRASSFFARDNVASFIGWCRSELNIPESVMFETNDLVLRVNEKNVILCLLEVARQGSKFGVPAPVLIQMEQDIDKEIEFDKEAKHKNNNQRPKQPVAQKVTCDFKSLDEMVQYILGMCTCPSQFPMVKVSDGKYKVGDSENLIFMRILRQHVMVRVGGGWDTLEHYLDKHDPCRCQRHRGDKSLSPRHSRTSSLSNSQSLQLTENTQRKPKKISHNPPETRYQRKDTKRVSASGRSTPRLDGERQIITRVTAQNNVFNRLSRPKSTPPIPSKPVVKQDDLLLVQRNKTGTHYVQRSTNSKSSVSNKKRSSETSLTQNHQRNRLSTSSVEGSSNNRMQNTNMRNTVGATPSNKQIKNLQSQYLKIQPGKINVGNKEVGQHALSSNGFGEVRPLSLPSRREMEMLRVFEKECIKNQSVITAEDISECDITSEDNEVALHMGDHTTEKQKPHQDDKTLFSHAFPKPRKDKMEQHDRRTKIPTPVSFMKPLLSSRSFDNTSHNFDCGQPKEELSKGNTQVTTNSYKLLDANHLNTDMSHKGNLKTFDVCSDEFIKPKYSSKSFDESDVNFYAVPNKKPTQNLLVNKNPLRGPQWV